MVSEEGILRSIWTLSWPTRLGLNSRYWIYRALTGIATDVFLAQNNCHKGDTAQFLIPAWTQISQKFGIGLTKWQYNAHKSVECLTFVARYYCGIRHQSMSISMQSLFQSSILRRGLSKHLFVDIYLGSNFEACIAFRMTSLKYKVSLSSNSFSTVVI